MRWLLCRVGHAAEPAHEVRIEERRAGSGCVVNDHSQSAAVDLEVVFEAVGAGVLGVIGEAKYGPGALIRRRIDRTGECDLAGGLRNPVEGDGCASCGDLLAVNIKDGVGNAVGFVRREGEAERSLSA